MKIKSIKVVYVEDTKVYEFTHECRFKCGFEGTKGLETEVLDNISTKKHNGLEVFIAIDAPDFIYDDIIKAINETINGRLDSF